MIGSGIFFLPVALAFYGGISLFGWIISGFGAILLAVVFARLSKLIPKGGGIYAYTRAGYGDFAGFLIFWGYWISIMCTNAAVSVALSSYLIDFFPAEYQSSFISVTIALVAIWVTTGINLLGTSKSGSVQLVSTLLKLVPLVLIGLGGLFYVNFDHFAPINVSSSSNVSAITASVTLTLFAFLGIESATVPADDVENPTVTIPKATLYGTVAVMVVYVVSTFSLMGLVSPTELQSSNAPFSDAAFKMWGTPGRYIVGVGALISTFGCLNGWILLQGQIPKAMAGDNLFPKLFGKVNKRGAPVAGLIIGSIAVTLLVFSNYTKGLASMYTYLILLGTFLAVIPYLFCSFAEALYWFRDRNFNRARLRKSLIIGIPAFLFSIWAVAGAGQESVFYGFLLLLAGIPFYVWVKSSTYE